MAVVRSSSLCILALPLLLSVTIILDLAVAFQFRSSHHHHLSLPSAQHHHYYQCRLKSSPSPLAVATSATFISSSSSEEREEEEQTGKAESGGQQISMSIVRDKTTSRAAYRNKQMIIMGKQNRWEDLLGLYEKQGKYFNNINYATMLNQLCRIRQLDSRNETFIRFMYELESRLESMGIREICNIIYSIGKMKLRSNISNQIISVISTNDNAKWLVDESSTQGVSNILWSVATLYGDSGSSSGNRNKASSVATHFIREIDDNAGWFVNEGKTQEVAITAWSCATLGTDVGNCQNLFQTIDDNAEWLITKGGPFEVANTAWAFSTLNFNASNNLFQLIDEHATELIRRGNTHSTAKIALAYATIVSSSSSLKPSDEETPLFLKAVEKHTDLLIARGNKLDYDHIIQAFERLKLKPPNLFIERRDSTVKDDGRPIINLERDAIIRNQKISSLGKENDWRELLILYEKEKDRFNNVNYATMMSQFGRIYRPSSSSAADGSSTDFRYNESFLRFIDDLADKMVNNGIRWMDIRGVANIAHALGKMRLRNCCSAVTRIMALISSKGNSSWVVNEGSAQAIANIAWAFATLGMAETAQTLLTAIDTNAEDIIKDDTATPQSIANILWSFATLGFNQSSKLFYLVGEKRNAEWLIKNGNAQAISNTVWAYATINHRQSPFLFSLIEDNAEDIILNRCSTDKPQGIANIAWGFATLGIKSTELFSIIDKKAANWLLLPEIRARYGNTQAITNTAWAAGKLGIKCPNLFSAIESQSEWLVRNCKAQEVAKTAYACAKLNLQSPTLFEHIDKRSEFFVKEGNTHSITNLVWAFAKLNVKISSSADELVLLKAIENESESIISNAKPEEIANTAWAFAMLNSRSEKLFSLIDEQANWLMGNGNVHVVANTAWSAAKLGINMPRLFAEITEHASWVAEKGKLQDVYNIAWAFEELALSPSDTLSNALSEVVTEKVHDNEQALIVEHEQEAISRNKKIHALGRDNEWKKMLELYQDEKDQFNNVNYATMMSQLGKCWTLNHKDPLFIIFRDDLADTIEREGLKWMGAREIANIIYGLGRMKLVSNASNRILNILSDRNNAKWLHGKGNPQDIANIAWACAMLGHESAEIFFQEIDNKSDWLINEGNPQIVSNIAWACSKLNFRATRLFEAIDKNAESFVRVGNTHIVANTVWAAASLGLKMGNVLVEIDNHTDWFLKEGNAQNILNLAWSCSELGIKSPKLFDAIESNAEWLILEGKSEAIENAASSFRNVGLEPPKLFMIKEQKAKDKKEAIRRNKKISDFGKEGEWKQILLLHQEEKSSFNNVNYATAINQLGKAESIDKRDSMFIAFVEELADQIGTKGIRWMGVRETANILYALGKMKIKSDAAKRIMELSSDSDNAAFLVKEGSPQEISSMAMAYSNLGINATNLFRRIEDRAEWLVQAGSPQVVANIAWAFSHLNISSSFVFAEIEKNAEWLVKEGSAANIVSIAIACAKLDFRLERVFDEINKHSKRLSEEGTRHEISSISYAFKTLNMDVPKHLTNALE